MSIILPNLNHSFISPVPVPVPVPDSGSGSGFRIRISVFSIRPSVLCWSPVREGTFALWLG